MAELYVNRLPKVDMKKSFSAGSKDKIGSRMRSYTHRLEPNNDVQWNTTKSMLITIQTMLPRKMLFCCLKPKREQRKRSKAFRHVMDEVKIHNILKQLRVLNAAAK